MPRQSKKQQKDPNAPKRPLSGYFLFARDERSKVKASQPNLSTTEVMKVIAKRWSDLDIERKKYYVNLSTEEKQRYNEAMIAYRKQTETVNE